MRRFELTLVIISFFVNPAYSYLDKTHQQIADEAVRLLREVARSDEYKELYDVPQYQNNLHEGASEQDYGSVQGNQRSFRHYFDPDAPKGQQGCPYESFYPLWQMKDILEKTAKESFGIYWEKNKYVDVTEPPGGYYESVPEWAWDSGGNKDLNNWLSAIHTYGYTESSRLEAYRRLGHVIHLLGDCAEPDHAFNVPHPGSDRANDVSDAILTGDVLALVGTYYGYERFIEETDFLLNPRRVERRDHFEDYFYDLARTAKSEARKSGLDIPLGLRKKLMRIGPADVIDIYWTPTINKDDRQQRGKYITLARAVLDPAAELSAGLMKDFHDIVNQPPFLKEIRITQDGELKYHATWKGQFHMFPPDPHTFNRGFHRLLDRVPEILVEGKTLLADKEAEIFLLFGPTVAPGEWMDPAVKVIIGENTIEYFNRIDDRTFKKTFTPTLSEKIRKQTDAVIEVHAKDLHTHYPREGLPEEGYELDSNPATPADVAGNDVPYDWRGYESGPDTNHKITIEREATPPFVRSVQLSSDNALYLYGEWKDIEGGNDREFVERDDVIRGGINIAETKQGTLRITFDQEVDEASLKVRLGRLDVAMKRIDETTMYEGEVDLTRLYRLRLDTVVQVHIEAKNVNNMTLDGNARTAVRLDETMDEWAGYEPGVDTYFNVRVFHKLEGDHIIKGRVRSHAADTMDSDWHVQKVFTYGNAYVQGPLEYWHPAGKPVSGGNLYYGFTYAEVTDPELFQMFMRYYRTFELIRARTSRGIFKISQAEYRDYLRLMELKEKLRKAVVCKTGGKPDWKVPVGDDGWCEIPIPVFPGEKNVIYVSFLARYVPELGKPSKISLEQQGIHSRVWFGYLGYDSAGFVGEDELDPAFAATAPDFDTPSQLDLQKVILKRQVREFKKRFKETRNNFPRPKDLEKMWQQRARKQQKEYEIEFKKKNGEADKWTEGLKSEYMDRMYEIPFEARKSWKEDLETWKQVREKALRDTIAALKDTEKKLTDTAEESLRVKEEINDWKAKLREEGGELCWGVGLEWESAAPHIYELGDTFSGNQIIPETRTGFRTTVHLWKIRIDETRRDNQIWGKYAGDNLNFVIGNLEYEDGPKPPFLFNLEPAAEPEYLIIKDFVDLNWDVPNPSPRVGAGPVQSLSGGIPKWDGVLRCVDSIYMNFMLSHMIEVEGYPIPDREKFDEISDIMLETWAEILPEQNKADDALALRLQKGEIDKQQLQKLKMEVVMKFSSQAKEAMKIRTELMKMNPAFDENVKQKILKGG